MLKDSEGGHTWNKIEQPEARYFDIDIMYCIQFIFIWDEKQINKGEYDNKI